MSGAGSDAAQLYRETSFPSGATAWREAEFSVVDLETTGLDPASDEIISFATVTVADGRIRLDDARYGLVRPNRMPEWDTIRIHGLREADLVEAPPLEEVLDELLEALAGRALVAHVAAVERGFLRAALSKRGDWSCGTRGWTRPRWTVSFAGCEDNHLPSGDPSGSPNWPVRSACRCTALTRRTATR